MVAAHKAIGQLAFPLLVFSIDESFDFQVHLRYWDKSFLTFSFKDLKSKNREKRVREMNNIEIEKRITHIQKVQDMYLSNARRRKIFASSTLYSVLICFLLQKC